MSGDVGMEIAGGLARFWSGGSGPSHTSISTAFALAGYDEPDDGGNKQERVFHAVRNAEEGVARQLVEELLNLLRSAGQFDLGVDHPPVRTLKRAVERSSHSLTEEGFIDWSDERDDARQGVEEGPSGSEVFIQERDSSAVVEVTTVPSVPLLIASLRRLAAALRPLVKRRQDRSGLQIEDEYDVQDAVESMLRSLYNDVRGEERTPSYAGSSSTMDFLLKDEEVAIEVKVTRQGRLEKHVKNELLIDINDYQGHPSVRTLIAVVYDIGGTFRNPAGFENDLTGRHRDLDVKVVVVGWPL